ncbi:uncharacterized protein ACBT57_015612 [Dama dama]
MGHGARTHSPSALPAPPRTHTHTRTHSHTHSLTRAGRLPARRPAGRSGYALRARRADIEEAGEGGGGGGGEGGGRGRRRLWSRCLSCSGERRWRSRGPGRSPNWSRGRTRAGREARRPAAIRARWCRAARSRAGRSQPFRKAALESGRQPARRITHFALFVVPVAPGSRCLLLSGGDGGGEKHEIIHAGDEFTAEQKKSKSEEKELRKKKKKKARETSKSTKAGSRGQRSRQRERGRPGEGKENLERNGASSRGSAKRAPGNRRLPRLDARLSAPATLGPWTGSLGRQKPEAAHLCPTRYKLLFTRELWQENSWIRKSIFTVENQLEACLY